MKKKQKNKKIFFLFDFYYTFTLKALDFSAELSYKCEMFGGLFSKSSVIDNDKLVSEKRRTIIQLKKKERKDARRASKKLEEQNEEDGESEAEEDMDVDSEADEPEVEEEEVRKEKKPKHKRKSEDEENPDLEDKYLSKLMSDDEEEEDAKKEETKAEEKTEDEDKEESEEKEEIIEDAETTEEPVNGTSAQVLDLKEAEFKKAERTIFIGNLPAVVMSTKRETKDFKKYINEFLEVKENENAIESIRFRSIHSTTTAPRKVAFISKEVDLKNVMNCYVVFKTKEQSMKALKLNGLIYKDHHLRVDHLTHPVKKENKLSIFIGNIDFEEKEETLWRYFNNRLIDPDDRKNIKNVISNVRIIRDSKTSFGKGFAIIQFIDTNYVSKALLLDGKKLVNRSLRITRCKKSLRNNNEMRSKFSKLNENQKTVVGRAKQLGKIDRRTLGKIVIEGERSKIGIKGSLRKGGVRVAKQRLGARKERRAKARITERSQAYKEKNAGK